MGYSVTVFMSRDTIKVDRLRKVDNCPFEHRVMIQLYAQQDILEQAAVVEHTNTADCSRLNTPGE
jgi:hypothetical protein